MGVGFPISDRSDRDQADIESPHHLGSTQLRCVDRSDFIIGEVGSSSLHRSYLVDPSPDAVLSMQTIRVPIEVSDRCPAELGG